MDNPFLMAIEQAGYNYLVKVKLKNINMLLMTKIEHTTGD